MEIAFQFTRSKSTFRRTPDVNTQIYTTGIYTCSMYENIFDTMKTFFIYEKILPPTL